MNKLEELLKEAGLTHKDLNKDAKEHIEEYKSVLELLEDSDDEVIIQQATDILVEMQVHFANMLKAIEKKPSKEKKTTSEEADEIIKRSEELLEEAEENFSTIEGCIELIDEAKKKERKAQRELRKAQIEAGEYTPPPPKSTLDRLGDGMVSLLKSLLASKPDYKKDDIKLNDIKDQYLSFLATNKVLFNLNGVKGAEDKVNQLIDDYLEAIKEKA